jgi:hypothetical protein
VAVSGNGRRQARWRLEKAPPNPRGLWHFLGNGGPLPPPGWVA